MRLRNLQLENFRNFEALNLDFDEDKNVTVLIGENAQGKTNILESIYFLALTRPFRTNHFIETITRGREHGRIKGGIKTSRDECDLEIAFDSRKHKKLRKGDIQVDSKKYLHNLTVVLFVPEDIHIAAGDPGTRRRYLNLMALQAFSGYLETLVLYTKALKHRNELLKNRAPRSHVDVWDEQLADLGLEIWSKRAEIISFFKKRVGEEYEKLSEKDDKLTIKYRPIPEDKAEYLDHMSANYEQDIARQTTSYGPHRDDFEILLNGEPIKKYGSRGESRTAVLALKLVELEFLTEKTGRKPILLLDDVLSELDHKRQKHLIGVILEHQTFLTTTCREHLGGFTGEIDVLTVKNGTVEKL